ncbi:MAG TPA: hypothetical protein VLL25_00950 [Acidimicrobiales bacterium]|nr:hypothetical protein [Acidimicrobiales bacterium]
MTDPRKGDHATGLELQIEELVARREQARREGWLDEVHVLELEITALHLQLAETAEEAAEETFRPVIIRGVDTAAHLIEPPRSA